MEEQKAQQVNTANTASRKQVQETDFVRIQDVVALCKEQWYWFIISVVVCLTAVTIYLKAYTPIYTRQATILIKEDGKGRTTSFNNEINSYVDMGVFNNMQTVENEVVLIQAPSAILEVIKRLNLDVDYTVDGTFHPITLYGSNLPIAVTFENLSDNEGCSFDFSVEKGNTVVINNVKYKNLEIEDSKAFKGHFGEPIMTPMGNVVVNKTPMANVIDMPSLIHIKRMSYVSCVNNYTKQLKANLTSKNTSIIDISFQDVSIQRAEEFLNMLIAVHNENWLKDKNLVAITTVQFITERLDDIAKELEQVESSISTYKSTQLIPNLEETTSSYIRQADVVSTQMMQLNTQLALAKYIRQFLNAPEGNTLLPANSGISSAVIEKQISDYNSKLLQRNSLAANSSERNPMVVDYDKTLELMLKAIITSVDNEINTINCQLAAFKSSEQDNNAKMATNPKQAKHLLSVERQQKVKESLYLFLLQKREEAQLSQAFTAYNTRVVNPPMGQNSPTFPVKKNFYLIALLIGVAIPVIIIYLKEANSTKVRGRKDLENLNIPFIGEIPLSYTPSKGFFNKVKRFFFKKKENKGSHIVVKEKSRNLMNEAFRVARTNLEFILGDDGKSKVIMTTSANPGSGKTFLSSNLAMSLAIKEKKILVIDLDLRRATLSKMIDNPEHGMSDYLGKHIEDWRDILVSGKLHENMDILAVGTIPPNPTELLYSDKLENLITEAKDIYDYIFIDCPPIEIVADTLVINKWVDLTIFVVRADLYEREYLPQLQEYYDEKKFKNLSIILNGTMLGSGGYGYGYRYGYGYGYRYGYGYGYGYSSNSYYSEK